MSDKRKEFMGNHSDEEKWFLADLEGNSLLPQTGLGIALFVFDTLFAGDFDEDTLERFVAYSPSDKEIAKAESLMSSFHTSFGIDKKKNVQILKNGQINELFISAKGLILNTLYFSLAKVMDSRRSFEGEDNVQSGLRNLKQLMTETSYPTAKQELSRLVRLATGTIRSESNGLCKDYKTYIRDTNVRVLAAKKARREGNYSIPTFEVTDKVRDTDSPLLKLEEKILENWLIDDKVSHLGEDRLRALLNGIQGEQ